jgi:hypothetical protein
MDLPELYKFEVIYGCEGFELRNNFPYWNISIFRMDFELKFRDFYEWI